MPETGTTFLTGICWYQELYNRSSGWGLVELEISCFNKSSSRTLPSINLYPYCPTKPKKGIYISKISYFLSCIVCMLNKFSGVLKLVVMIIKKIRYIETLSCPQTILGGLFPALNRLCAGYCQKLEIPERGFSYGHMFALTW